ncbi:MAG: tRNA (adenosine(37)-N6)-threonylcarbamoyltransferase complex transferase subunit TsaD, partial [Candidatus Magasanikbacteria bacterium]|nr:tRNA (adenosine(37)-N6)-threonylcarbamoyltransferase complex transferase subunit TsaD [Candidatus Magasanikbacteria bacterium]
MKILGIESSCDDTSVALVENTGSGFVVLAEKTASQIDVHKQYGGVVPEIAGREHAEAIVPLIAEILADQEKPDAIAVTAGPGLITGLIIGVEAAKTLSYLENIPLIRTNHMDGHVHSV